MNFFNLDSKFNQVMSKVFNIMALNFMFLILSIPILTIGANTTAMYYVLLKMAKGEDPYIWKNFWKSWRMNFFQATGIWIILAIPSALVLFDLFYADFLPGFARYLKLVFWMVGFILILIYSFIFPILSRFDNTSKNLLKNSILMAIRHLGYAVLICIINLAPLLIYAFASTWIASWILLFMLIGGFAAVAFACSYIFANEIFPYYEPHDEDENLTEEEELARAIMALENMDSEASNEDDDLTEEPVDMIPIQESSSDSAL